MADEHLDDECLENGHPIFNLADACEFFQVKDSARGVRLESSVGRVGEGTVVL